MGNKTSALKDFAKSKRNKTQKEEKYESNDNTLNTVSTYKAKHHILTPMGLLFQFYESKDRPFFIDVIESLPLKEQLDILNEENISTKTKRVSMVHKLSLKNPDLRKSTEKQNLLESILNLFYEEQRKISVHHPIYWNQQQIPLSLFAFFMRRLRREPDGENDDGYKKDWGSTDAMWLFVHYLNLFCIDKNWTGKDLHDFVNETIKEHGIKEVSNALVDTVRSKYLLHNNLHCHVNLKRVKAKLRAWYIGYYRLNWCNVIIALRHENASLSHVLGSVLGDIHDFGHFGNSKSRTKVFAALKSKKLTFAEFKYIERMWNRAISKVMSTQDIDDEWPGLSKQLLRDIYGTHKLLKFGAFNLAEYEPFDFKKSVQSAECGKRPVFGKVICSHLLKKHSQIFDLDLHPKWLIHDDLFQFMATHFAMNLLVNNLKAIQIGSGVEIHCFIIPESVVSLYDHGVEFQGSIDDIDHFLKTTNEVIPKHLVDVESISQRFEALFQSVPDGKHETVAIIVDRRPLEQRVHLIEDDAEATVAKLKRNHCVGLQYKIMSERRGTTKSIRTWLHFGYNQSVRFWPEHLVWIIPRLFLMDNINGHEYLKRIYSNDYRHAFRTRLDDPVFNRYYKILTGYNHESVNYYRSESIPQRVEYQDYMSQKLNRQMLSFLSSNGYDSDAIFADVAHAMAGDSTDSNVICKIRAHSQNDRDFNSTLISLYDFTNKSHALCTISNVLEIWDCQFAKRLNRNLQKFQDENFQVDAGNVAEFDVSSVIRGLDHMVTVHNLFSLENKNRIRSFISKQIQCNSGEDCGAFLHQCTRRREKTANNESTKDEPAPDKVESLCLLTMNNLCAAHCYLLHSDDILYRRSGESAKFEMNPFATEVLEDDIEEKKGDEEAADGALLSIDWGKHILEWLPFGVHPHFKSFMEEMLGNPQSTLNEYLMSWYLTECTEKMKEAKDRGIVYTKDELLCLKLYSDTNDLQAAFRRAHWVRTPLDIKRSFYNWGITMYKTFLFHAVPSIHLNLYHGLNRMFTIDDVSPFYNGPFSTTSAWSVAHSFSNGNGLLFTIGVNQLNPLKLVMGIDMKSISCHPNEQEVLLYSQTIPIKNTKAFESDDEPLINHLMASLKNVRDPITNKADFYRKIGIKFKNDWTPSILKHSELFAKSNYDDRIVFHRLKHELNVFGDEINVEQQPNQLLIESAVKLDIHSSLKMNGSTVHIQNKKDITIAANTVIQTEQKEIDILRKEIFIESDDCISNEGVVRFVGYGGGIIALSASKDITNNGKIELQKYEDANTVTITGIILFEAGGRFENNGNVKCCVNGTVIISCSEFVDNGLMVPRPVVVIGREQTMDTFEFIDTLTSMNTEETMKLTVRKHRGHRRGYHPQNLLKEGTGDWYHSAFSNGPPNEDWIVFEHDEESRFIPTTVIIRNSDWKRGIKRIAIYGGNNIDDLEEWMEIDGIHNDWRNVERQIFPIGSRQRYIAYIEQFKYFKLRVLENHGGEYNEFYEFAILGVRVE